MSFKKRIRDYKRVLQIARKPSKDEFLTSSKITSLGLVLIGFIGFVIFLAFILIGI
jgi:protein transport protein SEC61 subunit gamma-like protein